ncbi:MAG: hypothetical protein D6726_00575 [Nitrospirae bacterium]|nr:MAG: hypothetical protein D6726_00575 [Nitrospirota bacterium]
MFLGVAYFAIYRNSVLIDFLKRHPVNFDRYVSETVPEQYCNYLKDTSLMKERYDTGKLLNILLQKEGRKLTYLHSDKLCHFSGFSGITMKIQEGKIPALFLKDRYSLMGRIVSVFKKLLYGEDVDKRVQEALNEHKKPVFHVRRIKINEYLKELLYCLHDGKKFRGNLMNVDDPWVREKVKSLRREVENLFREYYDEYRQLTK